MITRILFDLDGVLADFHGQALKFVACDSGITVDQLQGETWLSDVLGITEDEFWRRINLDAKAFWTEIPLLSDAHELVEEGIAAVGLDNVGICSSPSRDPHSVAYKMMWVRKHFPKLYRRVVITPAKHFCANPATLLIDDWERNQHFEDFGGHFLLIPRRWNSRHAEADQAADVVRAYLQSSKFLRGYLHGTK